MAAQRGVVPPEVDPDSRWWWEGVADGRLLLPQCRACHRFSFPPLPTCPHCGRRHLDHIEASGHGRVYAWVVVHVALDPAFAGDVPYAIVAVDLDEGPRMLGRFDADPAELDDGLAVQARAYEVDGVHLLGFAPSP